MSHSILPSWLKPSASVDLAQVWFRIRPAMRTELAQRTNPAEIRRWALRFGLFPAVDHDMFLVLSGTPSLSRRILNMDRGPGNHTFALGCSLGYPYCCCRKAALVGDAGLDALAGTFHPEDFWGPFKMINPLGYKEGCALISHVPCSPRCMPSLRKADRLNRNLGNFAQTTTGRVPMEDWPQAPQPS
jgi:hypothetical protein